MKKTVQVIKTLDSQGFESSLQKALNDGYELKSSTAFPIDNYPTYVAVLIKEVEENDVPLPIAGGIN